MAGTLTVACKIPNGLIMQVFGSEDFQEPVMGGGTRTVQRAKPLGAPVKLNGPARFATKAMAHDIRFGVGLTYGVDADTFTKWIEQNKASDFVVRGLVFAHAKTSEVDAQAKDYVTIKSGFEELDPRNMPDEFKRKIETADV